MGRTTRHLGALLAVVALAGLARGEEPASQPVKKPATTGVLVLKSGRVAEGRIVQTAGGYEVEMANGRMLVPFRQVQVQATDRRDAYRKLRWNMPAKAAEYHVHLAEWCMSQQLLDLARVELTDALKLEPDNELARGQLRRLEELINPKAPIHKQREQSKPRTIDGFTRPPAKSLAGLPPEAAEEFATRVQPILLNKCGNTSCHGGAAGGDFKLSQLPGTGGSRRIYSERNLAQVIEQIDVQRPHQSPLLVIPRGTHGQGGQSVFRGRSGAEQISLLQQWVESVAPKRADETPAESLFASGAGARQATERPDPRQSSDLPAAVRQTRSANAGEPAVPDLLEQVLRDERPDAFDPDVFNRRVLQERRQ